jgi:hypothetical protein
MDDVSRAKIQQVAAAQLAVYGQIERRKIPSSFVHVQADADCPDFLQLWQWPLPNALALVPRCVAYRLS